MTLARNLLIILVSAFIGLPLAAESQGPGGEGGVVILPASSNITDGSGTGTDKVKSSVTVSASSSIRLRLPTEMVDAHAVMLVAGNIEIGVRVVAQEIEIDAETIAILEEEGIERIDLLIVSANSLALRVSVVLNDGNATVKVY